MLKLILKIILAIVVLGSALFLYAAYQYKSKIEAIVEQSVVAYGRKSNLNIAFESFNLNFMGMQADTLNVFIPKAFLSFKIDKPRIDLPILSALLLSPKVNILGNFYESEIEASTIYSLTKQSAVGQFQVAKMDLSKIPQLSFLGITNGKVDFSINNFLIGTKGPQSFDSTISIEDFKTEGERTIRAAVNKQYEQIPIPPVNNLNLHANLNFNNKKLIISDGMLNSDLGNASCIGGLDLDDSSSNGYLRLNLNFNLSPKGLKFFGYLLPRISNNILDENSNKFILNIEGPISDLKYRYGL